LRKPIGKTKLMIVAVSGNNEQSGFAGCKDQTRQPPRATSKPSAIGIAREALSEED
jgi:hypothetical protein